MNCERIMRIVYMYMVFYNAALEIYQLCINVFIVKSYGKSYLKNIYIFSTLMNTLMNAGLRT